MGHYATQFLGDVSTTASGARRIKDVVAALVPPAKGSEALTKKEEPHRSLSGAAMGLVPGVIGAGAGAYMWKKHRVLGAVLGHAVGTVALPLVKGGERVKALSQLAVEGAGVVGALKYKKHPFIGFLGGAIAGAVVTAFVPGSAANHYWHAWRSK